MRDQINRHTRTGITATYTRQKIAENKKIEEEGEGKKKKEKKDDEFSAIRKRKWLLRLRSLDVLLWFFTFSCWGELEWFCVWCVSHSRVVVVSDHVRSWRDKKTKIDPNSKAPWSITKRRLTFQTLKFNPYLKIYNIKIRLVN